MIVNTKKQYPERVTKLVVRQLLAKFPDPVLFKSAELFLNRKLAAYIGNGELDFLENRLWKLEVTDAPRAVCIRLEGRRLRVGPCPDAVDLTFKGPISSFITLALKEQDPDSLFFNRQLGISGDTALGLEIKNFIDRLPLETMLTFPLSTLMRHLDRVFNDSGCERNRPA